MNQEKGGPVTSHTSLSVCHLVPPHLHLFDPQPTGVEKVPAEIMDVKMTEDVFFTRSQEFCITNNECDNILKT